ncbi:FMN-binding negative transcriptional regulator [Paenibacillus sp. GSMTC-2017]|uniref:FMN-binding negative transcriptional regulator n=1 Tax=Paenibacillus sp. GSMTC-2017 TaxID=2794350 RepID=UPI0018D6E546|nr:FMN-binding negative transcriptional regulator [Paenibacillus sp. GSMTC-2017]MBH5317674.1 FMN-binding negative transcriptional regulator [Paenibacillus sp. GSMTC-2017]
MYIPKHFLVEDQTTIYDFIDRNSFGIIVSAENNTPTASHLPFLLNRNEGCLYSHFARPNSQWIDIVGQEVLIIFPGPHTYISSSWYESTLPVPTWNYVAVHVYGYIEIIEDQKEVISTLEKLVAKYERKSSSYKFDETNQTFIEGLSKGIVAFKLSITRMEGKWKLSQNHSEERRKRVVDNLEQLQSEDALSIAKLMKNNLNESV